MQQNTARPPRFSMGEQVEEFGNVHATGRLSDSGGLCTGGNVALGDRELSEKPRLDPRNYRRSAGRAGNDLPGR